MRTPPPGITTIEHARFEQFCADLGMTPREFQDAWAAEVLHLSPEEQLLLNGADLADYDRNSPAVKAVVQKMLARAAAKALKQRQENT